MTFEPLEIEESIEKRFGLRCVADKLRDRLHLLRGEDRRLIGPYLQYGLSLRELSQLTGLERRRLTRKVRRLLHGLANDHYVTLHRHNDTLAPLELAVGYDRFIRSESCETISQRYGLSLWKIRKMCIKLEALIETKNNFYRESASDGLKNI